CSGREFDGGHQGCIETEPLCRRAGALGDVAQVPCEPYGHERGAAAEVCVVALGVGLAAANPPAITRRLGEVAAREDLARDEVAAASGLRVDPPPQLVGRRTDVSRPSALNLARVVEDTLQQSLHLHERARACNVVAAR